MLKLMILFSALAFSSVSFAAKKGYYLFDQKVPEIQRATKLPAPQLVSPANLAKIEGTAVQLQWEPVAGATWYKIQVATDPYFRFRITDTYQDTPGFTQEGLVAGESYYWRVYPGDSAKKPGYTIGHSALGAFDVR